MKVGDIVASRGPEIFVLHSSCHYYPHAIVIQENPLILVSEEGDMKWEATIKPEYFKVLGKASEDVLKNCLKRLSDVSEEESWEKMLSSCVNAVDLAYQSVVDPRLKDTEFLIEADHFSQLSLWEKCHTLVKWEEDSRGIFFTIGNLAGHPIAVNLSWAKLNGHRICFYSADSRVVDWQMIREWLDKICYPLWDNGTRHARTNAMNFHHCFQHVIK